MADSPEEKKALRVIAVLALAGILMSPFLLGTAGPVPFGMWLAVCVAVWLVTRG